MVERSAGITAGPGSRRVLMALPTEKRALIQGRRAARARMSGSRRWTVVVFAVIAGLVLPSTAIAYERPGRTHQVNVRDDGTRPPSEQGWGGGALGTGRSSCYTTSITPNGRYVAFVTHVALVPEDRNDATDVYVRDLKKGTTELISKAPDGSAATGPPVGSPGVLEPVRYVSGDPVITPNGRFVAFASNAVDLVPEGATNFSSDVYVYDRWLDRMEMVSVNRSGLGHPPPTPFTPTFSKYPSISDDGRLVAFSSGASDLVEGQTDSPFDNGKFDVFVRDRKRAITRLITVDSDGNPSSGSCWLYACGSTFSPVPSISGNGRFVAFDSLASDLVDDDTNEVADVFVHDLKTGMTERVSVASDGSQAIDPEGSSVWPHYAGSTLDSFHVTARQISRNGRYVLFRSRAQNLVPNKSNRRPEPIFNPHNSGHDVYVHDRRTGRTERVSVTSEGLESNYGFQPFQLNPSLSPNGRYVTYVGLEHSGRRLTSIADDHEGSDDGSPEGVVLHDRRMGTTELVALRDNGKPFEPHVATNCGDVSASGRFVSFSSKFLGLLPEGAERPDRESWYRDRGDAVGSAIPAGRRSGRGTRGARLSVREVEGFSRTGFARVRNRYGRAPIPVPGAQIRSLSIAHRRSLNDLFFKIDLEQIPGPRIGSESLSAVGNPTLIYGVDLSYDGNPYQVRITKSGPLAEFGLFRCDGRSCWEVLSLRGGYGTVGESVVVSVPLDALGHDGAGEIGDLRAFSGTGTYQTGPESMLDVVGP